MKFFGIIVRIEFICLATHDKSRFGVKERLPVAGSRLDPIYKCHINKVAMGRQLVCYRKRHLQKTLPNRAHNSVNGVFGVFPKLEGL